MVFPIEIVPMGREHWKWFRDTASPVLCHDTTGLVAMQGKEILGGVAFDSWSHNSCLAHISIRDPRVTRRLIRAGCDFVFHYADCGVMTGLTPANNERALRLNRGIGLLEVYRIREGYAKGIDYVLQEMRRKDCRWIEPVYREAA